MRLAILASHPIQYQAPLFRRLAAQDGLEIEVFFCSRWGIEPYSDPGFGRTFAWDVPVLDGYNHLFLRNARRNGTPATFCGLINPGIITAICRGCYDAVLVHGWASVTNWMCIAAALSTRLPVLLRGESSILLERKGFLRVYRHALLSSLFRHVSAFLAIGTNNAAFYKSFGVRNEKIFLAPYSVDNARFLSEEDRLRPQRRSIRAAFGIADDAPVILFSGKFLRRKRPMDLMAAYESVADSGAWLLLVGDGEVRRELEEFVSARRLNRVRFLGFLNQGEISKAYVASDVFVLPSDYETWGLVVNEAMCFGLPTITSDRVGSSTDLIQDGNNGYIFSAGDVRMLAKYLRRILEDSDRRAQMSNASRAVISSWGLDQTTAGILSALSAVRVKTR